jgi:hypothetical protein
MDQMLGEVAALHRDFPAWATWLPRQGQWTAVRPASDRPPEPGSPLLWACAPTPQELRHEMQAIDTELARQRR